MLKKLFVHEWKDTWRLNTLLCVCVLGITLLGMIGVRVLSGHSHDNFWINGITITYVFLYVVSLVALSLVVTFYFYVRFYKHLFTDQGYLLFTLPVQSRDLIFSKLFVAMIWRAIGVLVIYFSVAMILFGADPGSVVHLTVELFNGFSELALFDQFYAVIMIFIIAVTGSVFSNFMGYLSICIGQTFKKNRVIGAVLVFIGLTTLLQIVTNVIMVPSLLIIDKSNFNPEMLMRVYPCVMAILFVVASIVMYFIMTNIMKNKLNLE